MMTLTERLVYQSASARRQRELEIVSDGSFATSRQLSQLLGVSEVTVRRDVRLLAKQGLVRLVHGGAAKAPEPVGGSDFRMRSALHVTRKSWIADAALQLLRDETVVAFDAGSTVLALAKDLPSDLRLSIVTASLPVLAVLSDRRGLEIVGLGGMFEIKNQRFAGPLTLKTIASLHVDQLFLAASAVRDGNVWSDNQLDCGVKQALFDIADEVVLLADSSKFQRTALMKVRPLSEVHVVVTDMELSQAGRDQIQSSGCRLVLAGPAERPQEQTLSTVANPATQASVPIASGIPGR